jgi:predicted nucleic acid-binding protein
MNGPINGKLVLDRNIVINRLNKKIAALPGEESAAKPQYIISVVTEMEALANPRDTEKSRKEIKNLLSKFTIIPLTDNIKETAIEIRRSGSPRPKLPDAIIAATAVVLDAVLVTRDNDLLRLSFSGLQTMNIS